jgi:hypothetical protein
MMMRFALVLLLCLFAVGTPVLAQDSAEVAFWESVRDSKNPDELQAYLDAYPDGKFAPLAKIRIKSLGGTAVESQPEAKPQAESKSAKPAGDTKKKAAQKKGPQLAAEKDTYGPLEPIKVSWSALPTSLHNGSIQVRKQGAADAVTTRSMSFSDQKSGDIELEGLLPGAYDLVLVTGPYGQEFIVARSTFTVVAPGEEGAGEAAALVPAAEEVPPFEPIELTWSKVPASMHNGSVRMLKEDGTQVTQQSFSISEQATGKLTFEGTLPGTYRFELITGPYGNELTLATANVTVVDPNAEAAPAQGEEQPAAEEEPQAEAPADGAAADQPAADGGATQQAAATQGSVERSTIGGIAFTDRPNPAEPELGKMVIDAIKPKVDVSCTGATEGYTWKVGNDDKRLQKLLSDTVLAVSGNGFAVSQVKADVNNALVYKGKPVAKDGKDPLLMIWILEEDAGLLDLVLCTTK